ncbi:methyltransferase domain-containing protein [Rhodobacteraceae bacterium D3-12]|nr:methyltransferase domain-containing protein [Rhodobacteraceae bacterium D3-12]
MNLPTRRQRFEEIYGKRLWKSTESASGRGSELDRTTNLRTKLPELIEKYDIKSIVDAPCGDFNWMRLVLEKVNVTYTGLDIVDDLIKDNNEKYRSDKVDFGRADICEDKLPACDLLIVRDCLIHLSYRDIDAFLKNIQDVDYKYLLVSSYVGDSEIENKDITTGDVRVVNLFKHPFNFDRDKVLDVILDVRKSTARVNSEILLRKSDVPVGVAETAV